MSELTPDEVTRQHQKAWDERAARIGASVEVSPCPYSAEELATLAADDKAVAYLPPEFATQATRGKLNEIFPLMGSYATLPDNPVSNDVSPSGWFDYEATAQMPYPGLTLDELLAQLEKDGRTLLTLNQYIVASQDFHDAHGRYLDEATHWVRLSSRFDGRIVGALIDGAGPYPGFPEHTIDGSLRCAHDMTGKENFPVLGARTTTTIPDERRNLVAEPEGHLTSPPPSAAEALYPSSFDLEAEWERQVAEYLRIGVADALAMSPQEYRASMPRFAPQPAAYAGRFDVPLLVETRLPWRELADLAGIETSVADRGFVFSPLDERSATPANPYTGWFTMWGRRFVEPIAPADAYLQLGADEVGGNVHEVIAMEIAHRQLSSNARYFEAVGYVSKLHDPGFEKMMAPVDRAPMINRTRRDVAQVSNNLHPIAYLTFRPLVRGDQITTSA